MAKREYSWKTTADRNGWHRCNPITGAVEATFTMPDDETTRNNLALYGYKQALSDGAATDAGTSSAARDRAMRDRDSDIQNGTWAFRDGHGTTAAKLPDALLYRAAVACNVFADTSDNRKIWAEATANARAALYQKEGIAEWLAANAAGADAAADLLATLKP